MAKEQKEKRTGLNGVTIPSRGAMGLAVELIDAGERDEEVIVSKVREQYPDAKDPTRHIRYVSRIMETPLNRPAKSGATEDAGE